MKNQATPIHSLALKDISLAHDGVMVLDQLSWSPAAGFVHVVNGPMGCGKSTLLKIIAGLEAPSRGHCMINGEDVLQYSFEEFLPLRLRIGYSFDMGGLLNNRTLKENLMLPMQYHRWGAPREMHERAESLLEAFELKDVAGLRPAMISGSQRKALCVARALVMTPDLLLLDEPLTGLNAKNRETLQKLIEEQFRSGNLKSVLVAGQADELVKGLPSRNWRLRNGKLFELESERVAA